MGKKRMQKNRCLLCFPYAGAEFSYQELIYLRGTSQMASILDISLRYSFCVSWRASGFNTADTSSFKGKLLMQISRSTIVSVYHLKKPTFEAYPTLQSSSSPDLRTCPIHCFQAHLDHPVCVHTSLMKATLEDDTSQSLVAALNSQAVS